MLPPHPLPIQFIPSAVIALSSLRSSPSGLPKWLLLLGFDSSMEALSLLICRSNLLIQGTCISGNLLQVASEEDCALSFRWNILALDREEKATMAGTRSRYDRPLYRVSEHDDLVLRAQSHSQMTVYLVCLFIVDVLSHI